MKPFVIVIAAALCIPPLASTETTDMKKGTEMTKNEMPSEEELKSTLTPEQYHVLRKNGTERPFQNEYWDNHREGIYVDRITGAPLFSSKDKFDSGTGWPSFTRPIDDSALENRSDTSHFMTRVEVRSKSSNSHLGHVFDDGPGPTGKRFCMNSASLRFIPKEEMEKEGYGEYLKHLKK